jgi:hypothetical protein
MGIRQIEGLHLTATNKRHLAEIIANGWTTGHSSRIAYTVTPIAGEPRRFAYHWRKPETDDYGRRVTREARHHRMTST